MFNQIEYQVGRDTDKAVNGVVYYLLFIQCSFVYFAKVLNNDNRCVLNLLIYVNPFNNQQQKPCFEV